MLLVLKINFLIILKEKKVKIKKIIMNLFMKIIFLLHLIKKENINNDNIINSNKKELNNNFNRNKTFDLLFSTGNKINEKNNRDYPETIKEEEYYL